MVRESFDQKLLAEKKVSFTFAINIRKVLARGLYYKKLRTRNGTPEKSLKRNH